MLVTKKIVKTCELKSYLSEKNKTFHRQKNIQQDLYQKNIKFA